MTDAAERKNGFRNLWGFGWTAGGIVGAALFTAFCVWIYGAAAFGWLHLIQAFQALPDGVKAVLAAIVTAVIYMGWIIIRLEKQHRELCDRVWRLEREFRDKHGW